MDLRKYTSVLLLGFLLVLFVSACAQNTPDAVFNRGLRAMQERDLLAAALHFDDFIQKFPEDERIVEVHWNLVYCYNMMNDYESARTVLEKIQEKYPDPLNKTNARFAIAKTYFDEGYYGDAIAAFEEIADSTSEPKIDIESYRWIGHSYAKQTQAATAVDYFDKAIEVAREEVENTTQSLDYQLQMLASKASVYRASSEFEKARDVFKTTLNLVDSVTGISGLEPVKEDAVLNWANSYVWAGDFITSATLYDQLQDNPHIMEQTKPRLIMWKIQSLIRLFQQDETEEFTPEERAVLVHEYQRLTGNYAKTNQGITANVEIARLVQDSTPAMSETYLDNAISAYNQMIAEPESREKPLIAHFGKADAYIKLNKLDEAKQSLKKIQQTYSNIPQAMRQANGMLQYIQRLEAEAQKPKETPIPNEADAEEQ